MAKEVLITGMEGMAGSHLARAALDADYKVIGTRHPQASTTNIDSLLGSNVATVFCCDLTERLDVRNLVESIAPNYVFHLAGKTNNPQSWSDDTLQANIAMCQNLVQELGRQGVKPRVVFASTVNVYGQGTSEEPFSEESPLRPATPYALSKVVQENLLTLYAQRLGIEVVTVRSSQHTGPGRAPGFVEYEIGEQILAIERGEIFPEISVQNETAEVDLLDVRDVASAYLLLAQKGDNRQTYNVSSGEGTPIRKIVQLMIAVSHIDNKGEVVIYSTDQKRFSLARYANQKILLLGWKPQFTLQQTLENFLDWMRNLAQVTC